MCRRYLRNYVDAEDEARKARRGMWRGASNLGCGEVLTTWGTHPTALAFSSSPLSANEVTAMIGIAPDLGRNSIRQVA